MKKLRFYQALPTLTPGLIHALERKMEQEEQEEQAVLNELYRQWGYVPPLRENRVFVVCDTPQPGKVHLIE